jgi:hypothetical protein
MVGEVRQKRLLRLKNGPNLPQGIYRASKRRRQLLDILYFPSLTVSNCLNTEKRRQVTPADGG